MKLTDDFKDLDSSRSARKFKTFPYILVPPFLWELVMKIGEKELDVAFMEILEEIDIFIDRNKECTKLNST